MKKKFHFNLKSRHWIVIMTIVCVGLIVTSLSTDYFAAPIRSVVGYLITPFQNGINTVGTALSSATQGFRDTVELTAENEALEKQVEELTTENNLLMQEQNELQRLRDLYDLDESYSQYDKVAASVISKDPGNWYSYFVINKGSRDGLTVDMNVIGGSGGLVGIITEVGDNWAQVRSLLDDESNVSVMVDESGVNFMVTGSLLTENEARLNYIQMRDPGNTAAVGTAVVTSNVSTKFLPGILVGYISTMEQDANELTKSGTIVPAADFSDLREVLVVTEVKQTKENS